MRHVGVAVSGGGHRATIWAFGVLLYLTDAAKQREVATISSVSGGSIANGILAHDFDYGAAGSADLRAKIKPALRHVADKGLFFWGPSTNAFVVATLGSLALGAVLVLIWLILALSLGAGSISAAGHAAGAVGLALLVAGGTLLSRRSIRVDRAIDTVHFGGVRTPLSAVRSSVEHVFCSTELQASDHLYMSPAFVYSYRFGLGKPVDLALSTAVQCSACLPGAFAVRRLSVKGLGFADPPADHVVLTDGGVYDNMADQWEVGLPDRLKAVPTLATRAGDLDEVVVANSSRGWSWRPMPPSRIYVLGEITALGRVKDVMYDVTTSHRRQQLIRRFDLAARTGEGMRGALVQIGQSPWQIPRTFADAASTWPDRAARATSALEGLEASGTTETEWDAIAERCGSVPTVLRKLGRDATVDLLLNAYVLAMTNLHVILGYPLLDVPDRAHFAALLD